MPVLRVMLAWVAVFAMALAATAQAVSIQRDGATYSATYKVVGWSGIVDAKEPPGGWSSLFALYVSDDHVGEADVQPMLGSYTVEQGALVFRPKYPIAQSLRVRAVFRAPGSTPIEADFDPASDSTLDQASDQLNEKSKIDLAPATFVEHVYPSTDLLPDNLLKFYIQFSAPMSRGEAWQRIHLLDEHGIAVELPFLEISQELWDRDQRRLTVLFDPGRIKQGVTPHEEMGSAMTAGKRYTLAIDREFSDAHGAPLREAFRKQIQATPSDRVPPELNQWKLTGPAARTTGALTVQFPDPMDWAMLQRVFEVHGPSGPVSGTVSVARNETEWRFIPSAPWQAGDYQLLVDTSFEDLAGNRIGRAFDVDLDKFDRVTERVERKTESLAFHVSSE